MDFRALPSGDYTLTNLKTPACLSGQDGDLIPLTLHVAGGKLADAATGPQIDMGGAIALPC